MTYDEWSFRMRASRYAWRARYVEQHIGPWRTAYELIAVGVWIALVTACTVGVWFLLGDSSYIAAACVCIVMFGSLPIFERLARTATRRKAIAFAREAKELDRERDVEAVRSTRESGVAGVVRQAAE